METSNYIDNHSKRSIQISLNSLENANMQSPSHKTQHENNSTRKISNRQSKQNSIQKNNSTQVVTGKLQNNLH